MKLNNLFPMRCMLCGFYACYDDLPVCQRCASVFQSMLTARCAKCNRTATNCECPEAVRSLMFFNPPKSKWFIYQVKTNTDKRTLRFLAELMVKANGINAESYQGVTFVPRTAKRRHRYGYDQSKALAKEISRVFGIPLIAPIKRLKGKPQKLLSRAQRMKTTKNFYEIPVIPEEKPKKLLLVDDVRTTGATLSACADLLRRELGCQVTVLSLAQTYLI